MKDYKVIKPLEIGRSSKYHKIVDPSDNKNYIIKKNKIDNEHGIPQSVVREIKVLKELKSEFIIEVKDIFSSEKTINIIMEYMPYTLEKLLSKKFPFNDEHLYSIMYQLITAVAFIHSKGFIHRDLNPSNILIDSKCQLRIAEFGSTRIASNNMTNDVSSLHYRAPELLLGENEYTNKVDSWSIGCIIFEIKNGSPLFDGADEVDQCKLILSKLGRADSPSPWDDLYMTEKYPSVEEWEELFKRAFGHIMNGKHLSVIKEMLQVDENRRLSVENALKTQLFKKREDLECIVECKEASFD